MNPRVFFITSSTQIGGAEKQLLEVIESLREVCRISIIILDATGPLMGMYEALGVETYVLTARGKFSRLLQTYRMIRILRETQPDCVQTWLYEADIIGGIAAKFSGVPRINWSARNTTLPHFASWKRWLLGALVRIVPTKVIANSHAAAQFHRSMGYPAVKLEVIPNYLPLWSMTVASESRLLTHSSPVWPLNLGVAARITHGKGLMELVTGVSICRENQMPVTLSILGAPGNLYRELQKRILDLDLEGHVTLKNPTLNVADWLSTIDIYVMSSTHWESHPNSFAEAIAIGCPVIISDNIESISDWDIQGPRYSPGDVHSLQNAINEMQRFGPHLVQEMSVHNRRQMKEVCSPDKITLLWEHCLLGATN